MQSVTFFSLFILGVSYGSTACMFSCMPFLAPLLVNNSGSVKQSFSVVLPFSLGRIFTYTLISIAALSSASFIKALLDDNSMFQMVLGIFTLFMGSYMLYTTLKKQNKSCSTSTLIPKKFTTSTFGLFGIGALVSINPCVPLLTLITISANSTSLADAIGIGIAFGLGAVLVPFVFYGFFLSNVIKGLLVEFKAYTKIIEITASLLLIVVGILILNGHIKL